MKYNQILKELRQENNLTQDQISRQLGMNRTTYTYYELGKTKPSIDVLIQLAKIYRVSIDELVGYEDNIKRIKGLSVASLRAEYGKVTPTKFSLPDIESDEQDLLISYRLLSDEDKLEALKFIETQRDNSR